MRDNPIWRKMQEEIVTLKMAHKMSTLYFPWPTNLAMMVLLRSANLVLNHFHLLEADVTMSNVHDVKSITRCDVRAFEGGILLPRPYLDVYRE